MNTIVKNPETFVVTGLNIGEETKSQTVEWLTWLLAAHTILRSGGSQCGHHVVREDGIDQELSHFGAGTFEGAKTHLKHMVITPVNLFTEAIALEEKGVKNVFDLITIDSECLTTTPFHGAMSRLREKLRGANKKGTVGMGVGEAIRDSKLTDPFLSIKAGEFVGDPKLLTKKVEAIRQFKIQQAAELLKNFDPADLPEEVIEELEVLNNVSLVEATVNSFIFLGELVQIVDDTFLEAILAREGVIVTEPSHGALLDPWYGFVPHVTQIDPTSQDILKTLEDHHYAGKVVRLGVMRSYMTRHGAGPLVSFNRQMTDTYVETHNAANPVGNEWLGEFRNGNFDVVATKYALEISGGKEKFDGLMISYLDVLNQYDEWQVCVGYKYMGKETNLENFFAESEGLITEIKKCPNTRDHVQLEHQEKLTQLLKECQPVLITLKPTVEKSLEEVFLDYVEEKLEVPVVAVARGPKKSDREIRPGWEHMFHQPDTSGKNTLDKNSFVATSL